MSKQLDNLIEKDSWDTSLWETLTESLNFYDPSVQYTPQNIVSA